MTCKKAEEYIILGDKLSFTPNEKEKMEQHISGCTRCKNLVAEMKSYHINIQGIKEADKTIEVPANICQVVLPPPTTKNNNSKTKGSPSKLFTLAAISRAAILVLLFLPVGTFLLQNHEYNKQAKSLVSTHTPNPNGFYANYSGCKETSKIIIKELLANNKRLRNIKVSSFGIINSRKDIDKYSAQVCQLSKAYYSENNLELRAKIVYDFIEREVNK